MKLLSLYIKLFIYEMILFDIDILNIDILTLIYQIMTFNSIYRKQQVFSFKIQA